jgi:hypothetical protein
MFRTLGLCLLLATIPRLALAQSAVASPVPVPVPAPAPVPVVVVVSADTSNDKADQAPLALAEDQPGVLDSDDAGAPIKIYGFGDIGYRQLMMPKNSPWFLFLNREPSFFVGNLNLYFDSQLSDRWRALMEVRFTYLPQGTPDSNLSTGTSPRTNTSVQDYTDFSRSHATGSIMLERAQIEYSAFSWLTITAGHWLTPYGIWNVDHGSPAIIGVSPPFIIGAQLLPASQVGLLAQGSVGLGGESELGYALGLSNGRIDQVPYEDLDGNKALTARLSLTYRGLGDLTVGATMYKGRTTQGENDLYFTPSGPRSQQVVSEQFDEVSYASDLKWVWHDFHLQTEWLLNDRKYTDAGRPSAANGGLRKDKRYFGGYGLVGYRTPFFGVMPYVKAEYSPEPELEAAGVSDKVAIFTGGLNWRPRPRVVFKGEYYYGYFPGADPTSFAGNSIKGLDLQIAWAF